MINKTFLAIDFYQFGNLKKIDLENKQKSAKSQKVPKSPKTHRVDPLDPQFLTEFFEVLWTKTSKNDNFPKNLPLC